MSAEAKRGLGRGLSALLGESASAPKAIPGRAQRHLPTGQLEPSPLQPRRNFDGAELESLAESIRSNGILQPILVRPHPSRPGIYEIVAGESARALMELSVALRVPIGNGILTVDTDAQAWTRAKPQQENKGGGAAEAALALVRLKRRLAPQRKR